MSGTTNNTHSASLLSMCCAAAAPATSCTNVDTTTEDDLTKSRSFISSLFGEEANTLLASVTSAGQKKKAEEEKRKAQEEEEERKRLEEVMKIASQRAASEPGDRSDDDVEGDELLPASGLATGKNGENNKKSRGSSANTRTSRNLGGAKFEAADAYHGGEEEEDLIEEDEEDDIEPPVNNNNNNKQQRAGYARSMSWSSLHSGVIQTAEDGSDQEKKKEDSSALRGVLSLPIEAEQTEGKAGASTNEPPKEAATTTPVTLRKLAQDAEDKAADAAADAAFATAAPFDESKDDEIAVAEAELIIPSSPTAASASNVTGGKDVAQKQEQPQQQQENEGDGSVQITSILDPHLTIPSLNHDETDCDETATQGNLSFAAEERSIELYRVDRSMAESTLASEDTTDNILNGDRATYKVEDVIPFLVDESAIIVDDDNNNDNVIGAIVDDLAAAAAVKEGDDAASVNTGAGTEAELKDDDKICLDGEEDKQIKLSDTNETEEETMEDSRNKEDASTAAANMSREQLQEEIELAALAAASGESCEVTLDKFESVVASIEAEEKRDAAWQRNIAMSRDHSRLVREAEDASPGSTSSRKSLRSKSTGRALASAAARVSSIRIPSRGRSLSRSRSVRSNRSVGDASKDIDNAVRGGYLARGSAPPSAAIPKRSSSPATVPKNIDLTSDTDLTRVSTLLDQLYGPSVTRARSDLRASKVLEKYEGKEDILVEVLEDKVALKSCDDKETGRAAEAGDMGAAANAAAAAILTIQGNSKNKEKEEEIEESTAVATATAATDAAAVQAVNAVESESKAKSPKKKKKKSVMRKLKKSVTKKVTRTEKVTRSEITENVPSSEADAKAVPDDEEAADRIKVVSGSEAGEEEVSADAADDRSIKSEISYAVSIGAAPGVGELHVMTNDGVQKFEGIPTDVTVKGEELSAPYPVRSPSFAKEPHIDPIAGGSLQITDKVGEDVSFEVDLESTVKFGSLKDKDVYLVVATDDELKEEREEEAVADAERAKPGHLESSHDMTLSKKSRSKLRFPSFGSRKKNMYMEMTGDEADSVACEI